MSSSNTIIGISGLMNTNSIKIWLFHLLMPNFQIDQALNGIMAEVNILVQYMCNSKTILLKVQLKSLTHQWHHHHLQNDYLRVRKSSSTNDHNQETVKNVEVVHAKVEVEKGEPVQIKKFRNVKLIISSPNNIY